MAVRSAVWRERRSEGEMCGNEGKDESIFTEEEEEEASGSKRAERTWASLEEREISGTAIVVL
jgi:hypothetical protein